MGGYVSTEIFRIWSFAISGTAEATECTAEVEILHGTAHHMG